jgi:hypothetical protein
MLLARRGREAGACDAAMAGTAIGVIAPVTFGPGVGLDP